MSNEQKINIRRKVRSTVRLLTDDEKKMQSDEVLRLLVKCDEFRSAHTVMLFWSLPDEIATHDFVEKWHTEKRILLPVVVGDDLILREYQGTSSMIEGAFGILEPTGEAIVDFDKIDLVVVPGVAFTREGVRMGRGKGFYDRFLPKTQAKKIGVCFTQQIVTDLPVEPWDVKMDKVIVKNE